MALRLRPTVKPMEVKLIDSMGNDLTTVNSARVSFNKVATEFADRDERLIKYLCDHHHWTPMSHISYQVRIKAPIFVARQWFKHQIGITRNEVSRRYVSDMPEFFSPEVWRGAPVNGAKQGSHGEITSNEIIRAYDDLISNALETYKSLLAEGVAPEQARIVLPQSCYTEWIESGSLVAGARICKQRLSHDAQSEIRDLAAMLQTELAQIAPITWKHLMNTGE